MTTERTAVIPAKNLHNISLDKALVLIGPQGCGKSQLAQAIAQHHCQSHQIETATVQDLTDEYRLHALLCKRPAVVIVDELPATAEQMAKVKELASSRVIKLWMKKQRRTASFPAPKLIFTSNGDSPYLPSATDRRFTVVDLGATLH
jgi:ABC-type glutathione transport system ATPase component